MFILLKLHIRCPQNLYVGYIIFSSSEFVYKLFNYHSKWTRSATATSESEARAQLAFWLDQWVNSCHTPQPQWSLHVDLWIKQCQKNSQLWVKVNQWFLYYQSLPFIPILSKSHHLIPLLYIYTAIFQTGSFTKISHQTPNMYVSSECTAI